MRIGFWGKQIAKLTAQNVILPAAYRIGCKNAVQRDLVIFADAHHDSRPESMEMLYQEIAGDGRHRIEEFYRDFGKLGAMEQIRQSIAFMKRYATAGAVILCDNFLPAAACKKREETKVIQLWHGPGAFKKFGYDAKDDIPSFYKSNVFANYDLVTVSGPSCIGPFQSAMRQPEGVVRAVGISRMDAWFDQDRIDRDKALFAQHYPKAKGKKVMVWAPTFRGNAGVPTLQGLSEMQSAAKQLSDEWELIISLHPHLLTYAGFESYRQPLTTAQLLTSADLLITDYSSILYDAVLLRKKLLIFAPDRDSYADNRGFYLRPEELPARMVTDAGELAAAIEDTDRQYDFHAQDAFREAYLSACDGQASKRIAALLG